MANKRVHDTAWQAGQRSGRMPAMQGSGMSKREYFAGMAIQSAITLPWAQGNPRQAAEAAVDFSDELLRALAVDGKTCSVPDGEVK